MKQALTLVAALLQVFAVEAKEIARGTVHSRGVNADLPYVVHAGEIAAATNPMPIAVYLKNLGIERIGKASDEKILDGLLRQGMLVAVLDYGGRAFTNEQSVLLDYYNLRACFGSGSVYSRMPGGYTWKELLPMMPFDQGTNKFLMFKMAGGSSVRASKDEIYIVPEGFTVFRHVKLGRNGNASPPAEEFFMDVVAPADAKRQVPIVVDNCTTVIAPQKAVDKTAVNANTPYWMSYTYFGYAFASVAHVVEVDGGGNRTFGVGAPVAKAIRMLRGRQAEWGLNGKVGVSGISAGAPASLLAAVRRPGQKPFTMTPELLKAAPYCHLYNGADVGPLVKDLYEKFGLNERYAEHEQAGKLRRPVSKDYEELPDEADLGPYANMSDRPDVALIYDFGLGNILRVIPCLTLDMPPAYIGCGLAINHYVMREKNFIPNSALSVRLLKAAMDERGVKNYIYEEQPGLFHEYNYFKYSEIKAFFGLHLKSNQKSAKER